ncbi:MAG: phage tail protein [Patiriisocius sp.]|uniref:phage tail protein n=1 Tax=Patiriisocius sp. TaxID=2822396 RepID=UPI003EF71897
MSAEQNDGAWPIPKFYFKVTFGSQDGAVVFNEVSGLDIEADVIEYRKSNSQMFATSKMPGLKKHGNVTLKKGVFVNDVNFKKWFESIDSDAVDYETVVIQLVDEFERPTMTWELNNALPIKMSGTGFNGNPN